MNTQIFMHAHPYSKRNFLIALVFLADVAAVTLVPSAAHAEWKVDLSRRQKEIRHSDMNGGASGEAYRETTSSRSPASSQPMFANDGQYGGQYTEPQQVKWPTAELPAPAPQATSFDAGEQVTELVIMNTQKGFVPNTVRLRKDVKYKLHVVNVNEKEKNISFVLDGFSEHQSTYYGKVKSFYLQPTREGVYSFNCPETSIEGRLVVFAPPGAANIRTPASEGK